MLWKRFLNALIVIAASTLAACLLYPMVYPVIHQWMDLSYPPARVFRRVWMLTVLAGLILSRKRLGIRHPGQVGFSLNHHWLPNLSIGLAAVFTFLLGLSVLYITIGAWRFPETVFNEKLLRKFMQGLIRGTLVSGLEEYVFRGLIFLSFCRYWGWIRSAVAASAIFSSLHFLEGRGTEILSNPASWDAGFRICGLLLSNMVNHFNLFPDAIGLFVAGMALCHAAWRTGSLCYGAGLHGGWVWFFTFSGVLFPATGTIGAFWIGGKPPVQRRDPHPSHVDHISVHGMAGTETDSALFRW